MTSNKNILLEDFQMQFAYKFNDKFDNELYVFKVNKDNELKKIKKEIKKMEKDNLLSGFCYEKEKELYIKVKSQHIKGITKINFEKDENYKTHLNLVHYDFKEKQGFYATMNYTKEVKSDAFDSN